MRVYFFQCYWPSNVVFVVSCRLSAVSRWTYSPNLRKIGRKLWSLSWVNGNTDRHTNRHAQRVRDITVKWFYTCPNALRCIGQTVIYWLIFNYLFFEKNKTSSALYTYTHEIIHHWLWVLRLHPPEAEPLPSVGLVIWPVKIVPEMTYNVSSVTLNPTHLLTRNHLPLTLSTSNR